ncbi:aldehyde dehydrogenase family protein [Francisella tularensis]|nr:aldehyde dehydrogenase family protein [Francisella tularensis]
MSILKELDLGLQAYITNDTNNVIETLNPATGELLAKVRNQSVTTMQEAIAKATEVAKQWRQVPAPKRGELVRLIDEELRRNKDHLGSLVSLEMGKSKQEGDGEVQEMIDMADFAVGQSRMLYGMMMNSERHNHRMYEQWHPLGVVGVISAFNFPVAVWSWNAFIAVICGNTVVWKPSEKIPLCSIAVHNICQKVIKEHNYPEIFTQSFLKMLRFQKH